MLTGENSKSNLMAFQYDKKLGIGIWNSILNFRSWKSYGKMPWLFHGKKLIPWTEVLAKSIKNTGTL